MQTDRMPLLVAELMSAYQQAPIWLRRTSLFGLVCYYLITVPLGTCLWFYHVPPGSPLECMARNIYWEASAAKQPWLGLRLVGWVTIARALDDRPYWGGKLLCEVVYKKHTASVGLLKRRRHITTAQFSWTLAPVAKRNPADSWKWARVVAATRRILEDPSAPEGFEEARYHLTIWWQWTRAVAAARVTLWGFSVPEEFQGARYYLNPQTSSKDGRCWFYKNKNRLKEIGPVGDHIFFREPKPGEAGTPPPENCRTKH